MSKKINYFLSNLIKFIIKSQIYIILFKILKKNLYCIYKHIIINIILNLINILSINSYINNQSNKILINIYLYIL
jgi:hypothetical protein